MGKSVLTFISGAVTSAALIFWLEVPAPMQWFGGADPEIVIETEALDTIWAPAAEERLAAFFGGRFALAGVRCRSTVCEIRVSGVAATGSPVSPGNGGLLGEILDQPWGTHFDLAETKILRSDVDGVDEFRVYVVKNESGSA